MFSIIKKHNKNIKIQVVIWEKKKIIELRKKLKNTMFTNVKDVEYFLN